MVIFSKQWRSYDALLRQRRIIAFMPDEVAVDLPLTLATRAGWHACGKSARAFHRSVVIVCALAFCLFGFLKPWNRQSHSAAVGDT